MEIADALRAISRLRGWQKVAVITCVMLTSPLWSWPVAFFLVFVALDACQAGPLQCVGCILMTVLAPMWMPCVFMWLVVWGKEY